METITIEAEAREIDSKGKLSALRNSGWIPAVVYGQSKKSQSKKKSGNATLKVNEKSFLKSIGAHKSSNAIIELKWNEEVANVVIKEIQRDILSHRVIHVDFNRIALTEKLEVMVPVHFTGEAPGVKLSGGILEHITRELRVRSLPKDIPSQIEVDVSGLEIGHGITVSQLKEISGVEILSDPGQLIANVVAPTILEEAPVATETVTAAEPEVIAKGKKPEDEEAAAQGTGGGKTEKPSGQTPGK